MVKILIVVTLTWTKTPLLVFIIVGSGCTPWPSPASCSCTSRVQSASIFEWEDAQSSIARFDFFNRNKLDTSRKKLTKLDFCLLLFNEKTISKTKRKKIKKTR